MPGPKRVLSLVGGNLLILILLVIAADFVARVATRGKHYTLFEDTSMFISGRDFIVDHAERGFILRPNYRSEKVNINSRGFRGEELPPDCDERFKIVVVGESTVFGWDVADEESFPAQLGRYLASRAPDSVCVVNAGVPSYTSAQTLIYLRDLVVDLKPDLVLIDIMWNDIWYSSIKNWFPEMLVLRRPKPWRLFLLRRSGLYTALALRADGDGGDVDIFNEAALEYYEHNLGEMVSACQAAGVSVALVRAPFDASHIDDAQSPIPGQRHFSKPFIVELQKRYTDAMRRVSAAHGVPLLDHKVSGEHLGQNALFGDPVHPTAQGNRLIAEDLGTYILGNVLPGSGN